MVRYFVNRPIAVIMMFVSFTLLGLIAAKKLPLSLLPDIDVPRIVIQVNYPEQSPSSVEENILKPIRTSLANVKGINAVNSMATGSFGTVLVDFNYNVNMELALIEVNEKIDLLAESFPKEIARPSIRRINTSDIPVINLQITPKDETSLAELSEFTSTVIKNKIERISGVGYVEISGDIPTEISIEFDERKLKSLSINKNFILENIRSSNTELSSLQIKNGQYTYSLSRSQGMKDLDAIKNIPVKISNELTVQLAELCKITFNSGTSTGYHLFNGKKSLVVSVHNTSESDMSAVVGELKKLTTVFNSSYTQFNFELSQDQSYILEAGISNLWQDIVFGTILTVALLFLFLGNWQMPLLMSITIPISLMVTFIFFYVFHLSLNIISLSGLALGVGMLIDNSIVVVDSIAHQRMGGLSIKESSVGGTNSVIVPVISQVLTTIAVYAPLIILSGIGGNLITDQSVALTISLFVSLLVAFVLTPVLFTLLFNDKKSKKTLVNTKFYDKISIGYHKLIDKALNNKFAFTSFLILFFVVGIIALKNVKFTTLPQIEKQESLVSIAWNDNLTLDENVKRATELIALVKKYVITSEAEVGINHSSYNTLANNIDQLQIYFLAKSQTDINSADEMIKRYLLKAFPVSTFQITDAPNAFTQLFSSKENFLDVRFKLKDGNDYQTNSTILNQIKKNRNFELGPGFTKENTFNFIVNENKMVLYHMDRLFIDNYLNEVFGDMVITSVKRTNTTTKVKLKSNDEKLLMDKLILPIKNLNGEEYHLKDFVTIAKSIDYKNITSDLNDRYFSISYNSGDADEIMSEIKAIAAANNADVNFAGEYFTNKKFNSEILAAFVAGLLLIYLILVIQYQRFWEPVIVMMSIPIGISAALIILWITNTPLDVMGGVGFIVVLGLIVDDPILKMETLMELEKKYSFSDTKDRNALIRKIIHEAGVICLKPMLMVSLTTSIALVPVLLIGGLGNDLQKPLAIVIIGGMTVGIFFTTWFIPLAYWFLKTHLHKKR